MVEAPTPIDLPHLLEVARRVRAARGYAGLSQASLADQLGISKETMKRWEKGDTKLADRIDTIARVCHVKPAFFTADWDRLPELEADPSTIEDEVDELRREVATLGGQMAELVLDVSALAAQVHQLSVAVAESTPGRGRPGTP